MTRDSSDDVRRAECLPLLAAVREAGWTTKRDIAHELGIRGSKLDQCIDVLEDTDGLQVADLGRITLLVAPASDIDEAIAQLFDEHERVWRVKRGDEMPDLDGRER